MAQELAVLTSSTNLTSWLLGKIEKFPRSHRYGLGLRLESKCYELIDDLVEAKYSSEKGDQLREAALKVEQIRFLLRLCVERKHLALRTHQYVIGELNEIGRAIGAWRRHVASKCATSHSR